MRQFIFSTLSVALLAGQSVWADDNIDALAGDETVLKQFVPQGFNLDGHYCDSDFNTDGKKDCWIMIKDTKPSGWEEDEKNPEQMVDRNRRGLIILLKTNTGYQKILENRALFASDNEYGGVYYAPELSIENKKSKLIFRYSHGRYGYWYYTFDYRTVNGKKDFYLIGYDSSYNRGPYVESTVSINFLTHKIRYQKNQETDWNSDTPRFKTIWRDFAKQPLIKLSDIDDIENIDLQNADKALIGID
ncbi:hypothetical protein [Moraxella sp. VT-16-12]|uniref:hypothetical protein n=1 Tax=Moraxella sp. VT-16-12 TaxID=2014877 RepID=UPI000B7FE486|nr:hypothetical protein [Moraxella sp. VT-16-12]TWV84666.1 hypothetical protein CEW93_000360 [Moraxella sp. VT-16-12]